jgi:hypothetical protein
MSNISQIPAKVQPRKLTEALVDSATGNGATLLIDKAQLQPSCGDMMRYAQRGRIQIII